MISFPPPIWCIPFHICTIEVWIWKIPIGFCALTRCPQLVAILGKSIGPLGGGAILECALIFYRQFYFLLPLILSFLCSYSLISPSFLPSFPADEMWSARFLNDRQASNNWVMTFLLGCIVSVWNSYPE